MSDGGSAYSRPPRIAPAACVSFPGVSPERVLRVEFIEYLKYEIGHLHGFKGVARFTSSKCQAGQQGFRAAMRRVGAELRKRQNFDLS